MRNKARGRWLPQTTTQALAKLEQTGRSPATGLRPGYGRNRVAHLLTPRQIKTWQVLVSR